MARPKKYPWYRFEKSSPYTFGSYRVKVNYTKITNDVFQTLSQICNKVLKKGVGLGDISPLEESNRTS